MGPLTLPHLQRWRWAARSGSLLRRWRIRYATAMETPALGIQFWLPSQRQRSANASAHGNTIPRRWRSPNAGARMTDFRILLSLLAGYIHSGYPHAVVPYTRAIGI
jgi:hypothetical protein